MSSSFESLSSWTEGEKDSLSEMTIASGYCAIDFGTSNSAIAIAAAPGEAAACAWSSSSPASGRCRRRCSTPPRAACTRRPQCEFGRAAVAAYVDGLDGRLMRSMKSILGSSLIDQTTDVGGGRAVRYLDIVATYLRT